MAGTSSTPSGALDSGQLGHVAHLGDRNPTEHLDALSQCVDQFQLFAGVLVQQQMQLLEGRPAYLPVVLLVQAVEDHRIGQVGLEPPPAVPAQPGCGAPPAPPEASHPR